MLFSLKLFTKYFVCFCEFFEYGFFPFQTGKTTDATIDKAFVCCYSHSEKQIRGE